MHQLLIRYWKLRDPYLTKMFIQRPLIFHFTLMNNMIYSLLLAITLPFSSQVSGGILNKNINVPDSDQELQVTSTSTSCVVYKIIIWKRNSKYLLNALPIQA